MHALIGGSHIPEAKRSPPTTHLDALMIPIPQQIITIKYQVLLLSLKTQ